MSEHTLLVFKDRERDELIRPYLIQPNPKSKLQCGLHVDRSAKQLPRLRRLRGVEPVQRTVITAPTLVGRIVAEIGIAQFIPAQGPMNEETQRGPFGPLAARQFGSPVSWKLASRASIVARTATAWWMMGGSPA